jgi:hypothetical protein
MSGEPARLSGLVDKISALKREHNPLLQQIMRDPGMSPALRRTLLEHLAEEENEVLTQIAAIAPHMATRYSRSVVGGLRTRREASPPSAVAVKPAVVAMPRARSGGLTVGSLRPEASAPASPGRSSIGSLRKR